MLFNCARVTIFVKCAFSKSEKEKQINIKYQFRQNVTKDDKYLQVSDKVLSRTSRCELLYIHHLRAVATSPKTVETLINGGHNLPPPGPPWSE